MNILILALLTSSVAFSAGWNPLSNPYKMQASFKSKFVDLPPDGHLKDSRLGWPGNHWANYVGGIAYRWSSMDPQNFSYKRHSLAELKNLDADEINQLSPAEKFDIFNGNYNYPTVTNVFSRVSPNESPWHGICHGYAPAAANHPEPASVTLVNRDGISIHFYSSDVAGLLSFYYANVATTPVTLVGSRCNYREYSEIPNRSQAACEDLNAGSFHIILTNKLGLSGTTFIADIDRFFEVWNHVPVSYEATYREEFQPAETSAPGTIKRVRVVNIVTYAAAIAPKFDPVLNTTNAEYVQHSYDYYLDLDRKGNIIGGDWIESLRPDFVWIKNKALFTKEWSSLNQIYRPAFSMLD